MAYLPVDRPTTVEPHVNSCLPASLISFDSYLHALWSTMEDCVDLLGSEFLGLGYIGSWHPSNLFSSLLILIHLETSDISVNFKLYTPAPLIIYFTPTNTVTSHITPTNYNASPDRQHGCQERYPAKIENRPRR